MDAKDNFNMVRNKTWMNSNFNIILNALTMQLAKKWQNQIDNEKQGQNSFICRQYNYMHKPQRFNIKKERDKQLFGTDLIQKKYQQLC